MTTSTRLCGPLRDDPEADDELQQRVLMYLTTADHISVRSLAVSAHSGIVTLCGTVPTFYVRQLAIACAGRVAGVRAIIDRIEARLNNGQQEPVRPK